MNHNHGDNARWPQPPVNPADGCYALSLDGAVPMAQLLAAVEQTVTTESTYQIRTSTKKRRSR